ncbi:hypothetical protein VNI00_016885 [Paramarasmius palmivorus]|uniref:DUF7587 domain-containing protein n=1 Tax=Paramarasmius palmivorus TaxID=297713 RepID=A0AAW0BB02_9AGAR
MAPPPEPPITGTLLYRVFQRQSPLREPEDQLIPGQNVLAAASEKQMIRHVFKWKLGDTPTRYRSASQSFVWALWEAWRRNKELPIPSNQIEILIIDCAHPSPLTIHRLYERPYLDMFDTNASRAWVQHAREVLVEGGIPEANIIARVSWSEICNHLPSFFNLYVKLEKGYRWRYEDCVGRCRSEGKKETRNSIETFLNKVFKPDLEKRVWEKILVDGYLRNMELHFFAHLFRDTTTPNDALIPMIHNYSHQTGRLEETNEKSVVALWRTFSQLQGGIGAIHSSGVLYNFEKSLADG